jgi:hypothetical protein
MCWLTVVYNVTPLKCLYQWPPLGQDTGKRKGGSNQSFTASDLTFHDACAIEKCRADPPFDPRGVSAMSKLITPNPSCFC